MNERIEQELFPFYVLDALSEVERAEVEAYVAADAEAKARLDSLMKTAEHLPYEAEPIQPSPDVKANLMRRVQDDRRAKATAVSPPASSRQPERLAFSDRLRRWYGRFQGHPALPALAAACVVLAIVSVVWGLRQAQQQADWQAQVADLEAENTSLQNEKEILRTQNDQLRQLLNDRDQQLATYQEPGSITLAIGDATGDHPEAGGTLTIDMETATAVFLAENLGQLDDTQVYQLWLIRGDTPVSAGIFAVDELGRGTLAVSSATPGTFDAIGLTIEPAGGSETPTLDQIILLGVVSS